MKSCTKDDFAERYLLPGVPCIIEDLVSDWPAYHKWSKEFFKEDLGRTPIYYHQLNDRDSDLNWRRWITQTHLSDFITRIERGERIKHFGVAHPIYDFVTTHPTLMRDVRLQTLENLLPDSRFCGLRRLDSRFWPWVPPYPPHMFIAGTGTESPGHFDPDMSHTFHWCVWGCKSVKLFPYNPQLRKYMWQLSKVDLSKPFDPVQFSKFPELRRLKGWSTLVKSGQTLFVPSKMWHFFKNEEVSMSFVVRARSFDSLESYCDFAADVQSPPNLIPNYARMWRMVDSRQRTVLGNLMAMFERPVIVGTRAVLKMLRLYLAGQHCIRRARSYLFK